MKVLSIGSDRKLFEEGSAVRSRILDYGNLSEELHIIVFANRSLGLHEETISKNIFLYPTNSWSRWSYIPSAIKKAFELRRSDLHVDVVTAQDPFESGLTAFLVSRILGAKLHLQVHIDFLNPYFGAESLMNRIRVYFGKFLLPRADAIRVVSENIRRSLLDISSKMPPITVLPIFIDTEEFKKGIITHDLKKKYPQFDFHTLMASRLVPQKNISLAIDAFKEISAKYPKAGLVISGNGTLEHELKKKVEKLGLEKSVIFENWQSDLVSYYKTADLFLLTSNYEGYGMTIVEALASGCPVIATVVGCAREVIKNGENGFIFPVGDKDALVSLMDRVIRKSVKFEIKPIKLETKKKYLESYNASLEDTLKKRVSATNILILTQKMDRNDDFLGFFHGWTEEFAKHFGKITLICLGKGEYDLPKNVKVLSLGKEQGVSRFRYVLNFYHYIWRERKNYDAVFVHMNQEYVLLGVSLWKMMGKKVSLWRNHPKGSFLTRIAMMLSNKIFCTSRYSFTAHSKKTIFMPVGIDTNLFEKENVARKHNSILFLGRIAPVKKPDLIIEALKIIDQGGVEMTATFCGSYLPEHTEYAETLVEKVKEYKLNDKIVFQKGIPHAKTPRIYNTHEVFINPSPSGMYDKTIFEAMACECLVLTSNLNLRGEIDDMFLFDEGDKRGLADKLKALLSLDPKIKKEKGEILRKYVIEKHSLEYLAQTLAKKLEKR